MEVGDDLSAALGTETLADRDTVPLASTTTLGSSADTLPIEIFEHRRFLRVVRSATLRSGQKVSKIWDHGTEYRALDTPRLPVASVGKIGNGKDSRRAYRSCGRP